MIEDFRILLVAFTQCLEELRRVHVVWTVEHLSIVIRPEQQMYLARKSACYNLGSFPDGGRHKFTNDSRIITYIFNAFTVIESVSDLKEGPTTEKRKIKGVLGVLLGVLATLAF